MSIGLQKLVILGGSSPFTVELIDQFVMESFRQVYRMVLHGRNAAQLDLINSYASRHLTPRGWQVTSSLDLDETLDRADIIIHQNRYGGLEGRLEDETFAHTFGFTADETLGPCGLKSGIRMAPYIEALSKKIVNLCPGAIVINLTNPLSIAVSIFKHHGVKNVIGICELPVTTHEKVAEVLELPAEKLDWQYGGLNHRGFIYDISAKGRNLFPAFLEKISGCGFNGFTATQIKTLGAIPLKYFHLFSASYNAGARAREVRLIGDRIILELTANTGRSPSSLKDRTMDWYEKGIIPLLNALNSEIPQPLILNLARNAGITIECRVLVSKAFIENFHSTALPADAGKWADIFTTHEKAVLTAALYPTPQNIGAALQLDPIATGHATDAVQDYILQSYYREHQHANT